MMTPRAETFGVGGTATAGRIGHLSSRRGPVAGQRGFTLLEVVIASTLVLLLAYLVMTLSKTGVDAQDYARRMGRCTELSQNVSESLREDIQSSVRIFSNDAIGMAYLDMLDTTDMPAAIDTSRLPTIDEDGVFEPETSTGTETGNAVLLARYAWSDEFQCTSAVNYRVDVYRFVYYYLSAVDGGPTPGRATGLDLAQWVSEPLVDGNQIENILDATDRAEVLEHLRTSSPDTSGQTHAPVSLVWRVVEAPSTLDTLRQIDTGGTMLSMPAAPRPTPALGNWTILADPTRSERGILAFRNHSIASNYAPNACGVGRFGWVDDTDDGFPHGFEVQAIGPSSARQVLLFMCIVSTSSGRLALHRTQIVTDARDL